MLGGSDSQGECLEVVVRVIGDGGPRCCSVHAMFYNYHSDCMFTCSVDPRRSGDKFSERRACV